MIYSSGIPLETIGEQLAYEHAKIELMNDFDAVNTAKVKGLKKVREEGIKEGEYNKAITIAKNAY